MCCLCGGVFWVCIDVDPWELVSLMYGVPKGHYCWHCQAKMERDDSESNNDG